MSTNLSMRQIGALEMQIFSRTSADSATPPLHQALVNCLLI
jgi:hypothetical protein